MKKDDPIISIDSIKFLVRHPWWFFCPFVIILCATVSYVEGIPNVYECESYVLIGAISENAQKLGTNRGANQLSNIYFGDNLKEVIKSVWPTLSEKSEPLRYAALMNALRSPRGGISIQSDRRAMNLFRISFRDRSPDICYKVVQSTINVIKLERTRALEQSIESSVIFLTRQLNFYRDKIDTVNAQMLRVSTKLRDMAIGLNPELRELVHKITAEATIEQGAGARAIMGEARNTDTLAELDMKLVEAERNKKMMELRLERKDFIPAISESLDKNEDIFQRSIEEKKMAIFELKSRGALPEHPDVKKLEKAVKDLEALREKDAFISNERPLSAGEKKIAERKLKKDLRELNFTIETLKEQRVVLEKYRIAVAGEPVAEEALVGPVAAEATKLKGLRDEKDIMMRYYSTLRAQLEETDLRSRMEKSSEGFTIDIVEPPKVPLKPIPTQGTRQLFFGLIMAIGAGSALSYLVDSLDKSIRSAAELRNKFQMPVIASIDRIYTAADIKSRRVQMGVISISLAVFAILAIVGIRVVMRY
jgi:hypothetical protein